MGEVCFFVPIMLACAYEYTCVHLWTHDENVLRKNQNGAVRFCIWGLL